MRPKYDWQEPYMAAVLEYDRTRIPRRIKVAADAIQARVIELKHVPPVTIDENVAIEDALRCLKTLRKQRV